MGETNRSLNILYLRGEKSKTDMTEARERREPKLRPEAEGESEEDLNNRLDAT